MFFLSISIIYYETNNIIITKTLSPLDVTIYNLAFKYVSIIGMFFSIILAPFWSAFIEARMLNDFTWMRLETKKLYKVFTLFFFGTIVLVFCSPFAYKIWFGKSVTVPLQLTIYMGIWQIFNMWNSLHSTLIYGFGKIRYSVNYFFLYEMGFKWSCFVANHFGGINFMDRTTSIEYLI